MFKKLLVVVLALTFLVSLCSVALATKDPNEFKRGTHFVGTPGAGRTLYNPQPIHPPTAVFTGTQPQYIPDPQPLMRSDAATCTVQSQYGSINFFFMVDQLASDKLSVGMLVRKSARLRPLAW